MKIISYCLYGNNHRYTTPIIINAKTVKDYYPGWTIRVYHDDTVSYEVLNILNQNEVQLININQSDVTHYNLAPKFWRFSPILESKVTAVIFRDADSTFSDREAALVKDWLDSDYTFHIIRDHQLHISPILAGMFGIKNHGFHILSALLFNNAQITNKNNYNSDQIFLADHLYPLIQKDSLVHTAYFAFYSENYIRINKCEIPNGFIGAVFTDKESGNNAILFDYDFIVGIPFWFAKLMRYRMRPVLHLSYYYNLILNKFKRK